MIGVLETRAEGFLSYVRKLCSLFRYTLEIGTSDVVRKMKMQLCIFVPELEKCDEIFVELM